MPTHGLDRRDFLKAVGAAALGPLFFSAKAYAAGRIKIEVNQHYDLADASKAHRDLEGRKTTGSSIFVL